MLCGLELIVEWQILGDVIDEVIVMFLIEDIVDVIMSEQEFGLWCGLLFVMEIGFFMVSDGIMIMFIYVGF